MALVKPQFEAGRAEASKGSGVVRDATVWRRVLGEVADAFAARGTPVVGAMASPITGATGNVEFLVHVRRGGAACDDAVLDAVVAEAGADPAEDEEHRDSDRRGVPRRTTGGGGDGRGAHDALRRARGPAPRSGDGAEWGAGLDYVVSLGGDGNMLRAVALVAQHDVPILG